MVLVNLLILLVALVIIWVMASIPAYVAGKVVTGGRATFFLIVKLAKRYKID